MTNQIDALKLALEALQFDGFTPEDATHHHLHGIAITAIKQALAAPVQEPVLVQMRVGATWATVDKPTVKEQKEKAQRLMRDYPGVYEMRLLTTLPVAQPAPVPLTLGQKQRLWSSVGYKPTLKDRVNAYGLAIESAHGIKENT